MKLDLFDIGEFIKINKIKEVTSPIGLSAAKMPNPEGIFSYDIFGYTTEERKNTFAYIDLRGNYFHPQCYRMLSRMGVLGKIASGDKYAIVVDRKIHPLSEDELAEYPDAETGVNFFYNNWEKINWNNTSFTTTDKSGEEDELSIDKKNRVKLFRYLKKNEVFCKYWLVIPPYYRDFNASDDASLGDDVNKVYKELILKTMALKKGFSDDFGFSSMGAVTRARIQDLLGILFDISLGPVTGKSVDINTKELKGNSKRSIIKRNLLGRFIDFSASSVISSPVSSAVETVDDFAHFGEVQLPLQTFCAMYKPFMINAVQQFLESWIEHIMGKVGKTIKKIDSNQWSINEVDKIVTRFIKSAAEKDNIVSFTYIDNENYKSAFVIEVLEVTDNNELIVERPITYLDLFYICAEEVSKDKYSINTRYPVANNQNTYCAKIKVLSTNMTRKVNLSVPEVFDKPQTYNKYPYISYEQIEKYIDDVKDPNPKPKTYYELYRATIVGNGHIKSLGADYDGDMMFFRGIYSRDGNIEAEKLIWKKTNWFNANGGLSRGIPQVGKDACLTIYEMTKD